jgi:hypothetical protein
VVSEWVGLGCCDPVKNPSEALLQAGTDDYIVCTLGVCAAEASFWWEVPDWNGQYMPQQPFAMPPIVFTGNTVEISVVENSVETIFGACVLSTPPNMTCGQKVGPYYDTNGTTDRANWEEEDTLQPTQTKYNTLQWGTGVPGWGDVTGIDYNGYQFAVAHNQLPEKLHIQSWDGYAKNTWPGYLAPTAATNTTLGNFKVCNGTYQPTSTYLTTC